MHASDGIVRENQFQPSFTLWVLFWDRLSFFYSWRTQGKSLGIAPPVSCLSSRLTLSHLDGYHSKTSLSILAGADQLSMHVTSLVVLEPAGCIPLLHWSEWLWLVMALPSRMIMTSPYLEIPYFCARFSFSSAKRWSTVFQSSERRPVLKDRFFARLVRRSKSEDLPMEPIILLYPWLKWNAPSLLVRGSSDKLW